MLLLWFQPYDTQKDQARGYKTFFVLNSAEHEIYSAHKC